ncbi:MAG: hypothetical protein HYZ14_11975 [Bacteroidetes bacterium]|nr:hypothetical protein [Bacteroidota bacterium]
MARPFFLILSGALLSGCVSVKEYAQAEKNLCDCLSGALAPADEFCAEWNRQVADEWEKLDRKMKRLQVFNIEKALEIQVEIDSVKAARQVCLEAVSKYYGGE